MPLPGYTRPADGITTTLPSIRIFATYAKWDENWGYSNTSGLQTKDSSGSGASPKVTSLSSPRLEVKAPLPLLSFVCRPEVLL
jgi:hypothetical protein